MQPLLTYEKYEKSKTNITPSEPAEIDLGILTYRFPETLVFHVTNIGKPAFYFNWLWDNAQIQQSYLSIQSNEMSGLVTSQSRSVVTVKVTPLRKTTFKNIKLSLQITKGPTYVVLLSGTAAAPLYEFSFRNYDFGLCFIQTTNEIFYKKNLCFSNIDEQPILLENKFEDNPQINVQMQASLVAPRAKLEIPIVFHPRTCGKYSEVIPFIINGTCTCNITVCGEGILMQVTVVNPKDKLIDLGSVLVGHRVNYNILVINKSKKTVNIKFTPEPKACPFTLKPKHVIPIKPSQTSTLTVKFAPKKLIHNFVGQIIMQCQSSTESLCIVKCSSIGADISLDRNILSFGNVVLGNSCVNRFLLINKGDVLVRYKWILNESQVFTITPNEGFSTPGTNIVHEVKFCPDKLLSEFRTDAVIKLEGYNELKLTITGRSIEVPPPTETIFVSCEVRKSTEITISCYPRIGQNLLITPTVIGEYFSGHGTLTVELNSAVEYELTYYPFSITSADSYHEGSVVFPFPDGSCLHYLVKGTAHPPLAEDTLTIDVFTHVVHKQNLPVINWLNNNQRFSVTFELLDKVNSDPFYKLTGNDIVDIGALQTRQYSITFLAHLPGTMKFKIVFTNESTHEYLWYELIYNIKQCMSLSEIDLNTRIREPVTYVITFKNIFLEPLHLSFYSSIKEVTAVNLPCVVQPGENKGVIIRYLPLHLTSSSQHAMVELRSDECGVFPYTINVTATPALPEPAINLVCEIGQQKQGRILLQNRSDSIATFLPINSHPDFNVKGPITANPGQYATLEVIYEPSSFDNSSLNLEVDSEEAGFFVIPLIGTCIKPSPIGPFVVFVNQSVKVTLTNVFEEAKTFCWYTDHPAFIVDTFTATVEPKQNLEIEVYMPLTDDIDSVKQDWKHIPITGKLIVCISDPTLSHIKWSFYIKGYL